MFFLIFLISISWWDNNQDHGRCILKEFVLPEKYGMEFQLLQVVSSTANKLSISPSISFLICCISKDIQRPKLASKFSFMDRQPPEGD